MAMTGFPAAARRSLADSQLRANLARATSTIRDKRGRAVEEVPDWEELRDAGAGIKDAALLDLAAHLEQLESAVTSAGGTVHWAKDGIEACSIVASLAHSHGVNEVVKVKSIATDEIDLNANLAANGIHALETDLAELIIQLDDDFPSHILVPAIHRNRAEIRDIFIRELGSDSLSDDPAALTEAARLHLRAKFLSARMGVSGANFAVAETGSVCVFESEGNGRMCTTLPDVLVTVMGIEKVIPSWRDMEVFLQLLPRSSTAERLNPYTSVWSGVAGPTAGGEGVSAREPAPAPPDSADGPREFHLVLLDNGRVQTLADEVGRQALRCIRCSACLNVCPVYARVGGHAYGSVYPGPIGAILTPQLRGIENARSLPYASSLCGACGEVCPVKIEIPRLLTHLRAREVASRRRFDPERLTMRALFHTFSSRARYERAQKVARTAARPFGTKISHAPPPLSGWTTSRDLPLPAKETFREWWRRTRGAGIQGTSTEGTGTEGTGTEGGAAPAKGPRARTMSDLSAQTTAKSDTVSALTAHMAANADTMSALTPHIGANADTVPAERADPAAGPGGGARADILHRIRSALAGATLPDIPRNYRTEDERGRDEIVTVFAERVAEYRATVHRVAESEIAETVGRVASEGGARRIGIPADFPEEWRPKGVGSKDVGGEEGGLELVEDSSLSVPELDNLDGALTACALGIAEVGAFVLDGGEGQGRRALSLVPDLHICVVREDQVVGLVPEAVRKLETSVKKGRPLTFVAGPSATSDIELDRVEGVHGPRVLHVILAA